MTFSGHDDSTINIILGLLLLLLLSEIYATSVNFINTRIEGYSGSLIRQYVVLLNVCNTMCGRPTDLYGLWA